jgi:transcriptional regulator with XRE-family HTH domain
MESSGPRLRSLREQKGLTQEQLARVMLVTTSQVSRWEAGVIPRKTNQRRLAKLYGVKPGDIWN